jgi:hypothetical protein
MNTPPLVFSVTQNGKDRQVSPGPKFWRALALISSDNSGFAIGTMAMSSRR